VHLAYLDNDVYMLEFTILIVLSNLARHEIGRGILDSSSSHVYNLIKVLFPVAAITRRTNHSAMLLLQWIIKNIRHV
jgi:hypothetical protein